MRRFWFIALIGGVSWLLSHGAVYGQESIGFTQEDRERIIRLETTLTLFMEATDQRFEQVDKRFEQVDKRFEQMMNTLQLIAGIFTVLTLGVIGFAFWDRRTIIHKAKQETLETLERDAVPKEEAIIDRAVAQAVQEIKKDNRLQDLIAALRKLAATDPPLANVLKEFHLL